MILSAKYGLTFSTDIEATISIVWRYLMQLGCDRDGWYSIDRLDHAVPSADHLVEGWKTRGVGDKPVATPAQDGFYDVYLR